MIYNKQINYLY